jgi:hypothetical protein
MEALITVRADGQGTRYEATVLLIK